MKELPKEYDFKDAERKWQRYWEEEGINKFDPASKKEIYSCDTPPPTVSGKMHIGHALAYSQADYIMRFHRMQGKNIFYPFGLDDNGLATERFVEKKRNVKATSMKRQEFIELCLKETEEAEKELKEQWSSLGISPDWSINYRTIDKRVQRISQLSFIELYKKGREYLKEAPTMWCPECQTAIAQVELQDKELSSFFNDVVFKVAGQDLIIATTRPELLPACVAIFYHPEDDRYKHLKGKKALVPLFNYEVPILEDEKVDREKGTGIVMCCTFGDVTDMEWYMKHNLPEKVAITKDGKMNKLAGKYEGQSLKTARKLIIEDLKDEKLLLTQTPIKHMVNVHERCGIEVEFLTTKQWFIKYLDLKDYFIEEGAKLNWRPVHMKVRYDNWIKGLQWDWCISRQRFFGVPFPVWYCKKCNEIMMAEEEELPVDPMEQKPKKECKCGSREFEPEKDVMDTWATSSLTPFIAARWKEDEKLFKRVFPMSLRSNGHDIITFWLFNTVVKSLLHEGQLPWKDVMINGYVMDAKGEKMSKSKGNIVEPMEVIEKYGADCLRFWAASTKLGDDVPFVEKELVSGRRMVVKLWNASKFTIMNLEDYDGKKPELEAMDKWIISKMNRLIKRCNEGFRDYEYSTTKQEVEKFFWHQFCDNYLEICKDRLYNKEQRGEEARRSAQYTLYNVALTIIKLIAPIMPHITEEIYQMHYADKEKKKSIHISGWPVYNDNLINDKAEQIGDLAVDIVGMTRKAKSEKSYSLKKPITKLVIRAKLKKEEFEKIIGDIKGATVAEDIVYKELDKNAKDEFETEISF
ncbi:MAG: valine--tRNA ligase [Candidatus Woesearchaeota archaeon]